MEINRQDREMHYVYDGLTCNAPWPDDFAAGVLGPKRLARLLLGELSLEELVAAHAELCAAWEAIENRQDAKGAEKKKSRKGMTHGTDDRTTRRD
jgi:hypothetical protein